MVGINLLEPPRDPAGNLRDLKRMGEPRPVEVAVAEVQDLRLALQTPERRGVDDPAVISGGPIAGVVGLGLPWFAAVVPIHMQLLSRLNSIQAAGTSRLR